MNSTLITLSRSTVVTLTQRPALRSLNLRSQGMTPLPKCALPSSNQQTDQHPTAPSIKRNKLTPQATLSQQWAMALTFPSPHPQNTLNSSSPPRILSSPTSKDNSSLNLTSSQRHSSLRTPQPSTPNVKQIWTSSKLSHSPRLSTVRSRQRSHLTTNS